MIKILNKYYIFVSDGPIDPFEIERLSYSSDDLYQPQQEKANIIVMRAPIDIESTLEKYLRTQRGGKMMVLASPYADKFMFDLAERHLDFFPNQLVFPSDLIFKRISFNDVSFFPDLHAYFANVTPVGMEAAGAYLRCGCDALVAASSIFVHRNTFNYRLNAFVRESGLDIRDYHNALLLEIYFQLSPRLSR